MPRAARYVLMPFLAFGYLVARTMENRGTAEVALRYAIVSGVIAAAGLLLFAFKPYAASALSVLAPAFLANPLTALW
jgi:O-antigen/teichoic acid export membrane protein